MYKRGEEREEENTGGKTELWNLGSVHLFSTPSLLGGLYTVWWIYRLQNAVKTLAYVEMQRVSRRTNVSV